MISCANFSEEQLAVFKALNTDSHYDYAIMQNLGLSSRKYYAIKDIVCKKVEKIAAELQFSCT